MKTSVTMVRRMGKFDICQRTGDGMFNGTDLLDKWNKSEGMQKRIDHYLNLTTTKEFTETLNDELKGTRNPANSNKTRAYDLIKGNKSKRESNIVWMHPYLFIDFAMWINPKFKFQVIRFVYDELIKQRNDAGDNYKMLSSSGMKLKGYDFVEVAKAMQWIVFNKTGKGLRQTANQDELMELNDIQTKLAFAIDMGYIDSYERLIKEMKRLWKNKYQVVPFS